MYNMEAFFMQTYSFFQKNLQNKFISLLVLKVA